MKNTRTYAVPMPDGRTEHVSSARPITAAMLALTDGVWHVVSVHTTIEVSRRAEYNYCRTTPNSDQATTVKVTEVAQ